MDIQIEKFQIIIKDETVLALKPKVSTVQMGVKLGQITNQSIKMEGYIRGPLGSHLGDKWDLNIQKFF